MQNGVKFYFQNGSGEIPTNIEKDGLISQLRERYSDKELLLLAKGEGLHDRQLDYPKIQLHGKHHKIGVMSDTHFGSKYTPEEWVMEAF